MNPGFAVFPARIKYFDDEKRRVQVEIFSTAKMDEDESTSEISGSVNGLHRYVSLLSGDELAELFLDNGIFSGNEKKVSSMFLKAQDQSNTATRIMGVVNATPDSFYPGSRIERDNMSQVDRMLDEKPDIIDIGGESTRPGSSTVGHEKEVSRILPVLEYVSNCSNIPVSIDSRNPETVLKCLDFRIEYINDISGFSNPSMINLAAETGLKSIVMHMRGTPKNMQEMTEYGDLVKEINSFLLDRTDRMLAAGVNPDNIIIDPGIGFSKTYQGNLEILRNIESFRGPFPLLVGTSRKTFLGHITGKDVNNRLAATIATSAYLAAKKVDIIRVHDVGENRDAVKVIGLLQKV